MEARFDVRGLTSNGVFFTEDSIAGATPIKRVFVEISRQNSNLNEVKAQMSKEASAAGANAIMSFRYGQRKHSFMQLIAFKWDTESWYGEGEAVIAKEAA